MHILLLLLFACVAVLLWAAFSVARHVGHHRSERRGNRAGTRDPEDHNALQPESAAIESAAKIAKGE